MAATTQDKQPKKVITRKQALEKKRANKSKRVVTAFVYPNDRKPNRFSKNNQPRPTKKTVRALNLKLKLAAQAEAKK